MADVVTLESVQGAARRLRGGVLVTPCAPSEALSERTGAVIACKLDNLQRTGSFKERGARNALLRLDPAARRRGVVAASAGNHALGLAWHGGLLGIPVTVVMPVTAPLVKVMTCRRLGATVVQEGSGFPEARAAADRLAAERGLTYVNGYDHPDVIAGQGTLGLEILRQCPDVEAIVVPVGGGGLVAGIAVAVKALRPEVRLVGVESRATASFTAARRAGRPVRIQARPTLADGLAVAEVGANAFALASPRLDDLVVVDEEKICLAVLQHVELEKTVVEGAAAAPLAAMLSPFGRSLRGRKVVLVVCGGNIDPAILGRVIDRGLAADGRLVRFTAVISDRPGGLARFAAVVAAAGASVREILHDRAFSGPDVSEVHAVCTLETRDRAHANAVRRDLEAAGFPVVG